MSTIAAESLADVVQKLGDVHLNRIRMRPAPGTATAEDVARIRDQEKRLYELVDGILVEKAMGFRQSLIAMSLGRIIGNYVNTNKSGLVIGADGMLRLSQSSVRIPDVAFIAWQRLPHGRIPTEPVPRLAPNLAVEVLSESNTPEEMRLKRREYFEANVQLVWEVDLDHRTVSVYSTPNDSIVLREQDTLAGDPVLPGFRLPLCELFGELDRGQL